MKRMDGRDTRVRVATVQDAQALLAIYAPYVKQTAITFEYEVPSADEFASRIARVLQRYPYLVAERGGEILGYAYVGAFNERAAYDWAVETSIYVKMAQKRQGLGKTLYHLLEEILKAQGILNLNACIAYTETPDTYLTNDSVAFHERLGYRLVGQFHQCGHKFNRWYDMVWMEKHIGAHQASQPAVKTFDAIREEVTQRLHLG